MLRLIRPRFVAAVAAALLLAVLLLTAGPSRAEPDPETTGMTETDEPAELMPLPHPELDPATEPLTRPVTFFEFGFWDDFQLFGPEADVHGLRINLAAARNHDVYGVDLFGLGNLTDSHQLGIQLGFYNRVGHDLGGVQLAVIASEVEGRTRALQASGLFNRAHEAGGVQVAGFLNRAKRVRGLQIGLVNDAGDLAGLQIGLVNVVRNGWIPVLPLFNFGPLRRDEVPAPAAEPPAYD